MVAPEQLKRICAACLRRIPGRVPTREVGPPPRVHACGCGQAVYCSEACEHSETARWHRRWECGGARCINSAKAFKDTKVLARLVLNTLLRGAYPLKSSACATSEAAGASWEEGVMLLESHGAHRTDTQRRDDLVTVGMIRSALQAPVSVDDDTSTQPVEWDTVPGLPKLLGALCSAVQCNNFGVTEGGDSGTATGRGVMRAQAVFPAASFFNHSCRPNVTRSHADDVSRATHATPPPPNLECHRFLLI